MGEGGETALSLAGSRAPPLGMPSRRKVSGALVDPMGPGRNGNGLEGTPKEGSWRACRPQVAGELEAARASGLSDARDLRERVYALEAQLEARDTEIGSLHVALGALTAESEAADGLRHELRLVSASAILLSERRGTVGIRAVLPLLQVREGAEAARREAAAARAEAAAAQQAQHESESRAQQAQEDISVWRERERRALQEAGLLRQALEEALKRLHALGAESDALVDRRIVVKLLVTYFEAPNDRIRREVVALMARMLGFTPEERSRVGLDRKAGAAVTSKVGALPLLLLLSSVGAAPWCLLLAPPLGRSQGSLLQHEMPGTHRMPPPPVQVLGVVGRVAALPLTAIEGGLKLAARRIGAEDDDDDEEEEEGQAGGGSQALATALAAPRPPLGSPGASAAASAGPGGKVSIADAWVDFLVQQAIIKGGREGSGGGSGSRRISRAGPSANLTDRVLLTP